MGRKISGGEKICGNEKGIVRDEGEKSGIERMRRDDLVLCSKNCLEMVCSNSF